MTKEKLKNKIIEIIYNKTWYEEETGDEMIHLDECIEKIKVLFDEIKDIK